MANIFLVGLLTIIALTPIAAQADENTDARHEKIRALGKGWNGKVAKGSFAAYGSVLKTQDTHGIKVKRDIAYGSHARTTLDVYLPNSTKNAPVVVYFHGGGLERGDKDTTSNVGYYFANHGMVGVSVNYRLVSDGAHYPNGAEDVLASLKWLRDNVKKFGGNPNSIFAIGHSSGGTVLGEYLYSPEIQKSSDWAPAGVIFLSGATGSYAVRPKTAEAYYGKDKSNWDNHSANGLLETYKGTKVPTLIVTAELDPFFIEIWSVEHLKLLCRMDKGCPRFTQIAHHNHVSTALSLNTGDDLFGSEVRDFIQAVLDKKVWQPTQ